MNLQMNLIYKLPNIWKNSLLKKINKKKKKQNLLVLIKTQILS